MNVLIVNTGNLYHASEASKFGGVNYSKLLDLVEADCGELSTRIAYVEDHNGTAKNFINVLNHLGFEVRTKPARRFGTTLYRNWNVEITLDIATTCRVSTNPRIILCTNDVDLAPAIRHYNSRAEFHVYAIGVPKVFKSLARTVNIPQKVSRDA